MHEPYLHVNVTEQPITGSRLASLFVQQSDVYFGKTVLPSIFKLWNEHFRMSRNPPHNRFRLKPHWHSCNNDIHLFKKPKVDYFDL